MYSISFFNYYRIGRFIFALALLVSFQMLEAYHAVSGLMFIVAAYCFIAFIRFIITSEKINYFDFLLDIVFISAVTHISFGIYSYLTLFYLFPIFLSSVLLKTKWAFFFPAFAGILYIVVHYIGGVIFERESILNISLHILSFSLIALAGNNLKGQLRNQEQYIKRLQEDKIKALGYERLYRVSADLAHELRNPLASISAAAQFLNEGKEDREFINIISTETKRLTSLVNDFLFFCRPTDAPKEKVDLSEMLNVMVTYHDSNKKILIDVLNNSSVTANRTLMEVATNNIIKNAEEAAKSTVKVTLKNAPHYLRFTMSEEKPTEERASKSNEMAVVEIQDDGAGIDEDVVDRIFEPFFTTKVNGTGLGLSIAHRIITNFGGNIFVDKSELGGAKFTIILPVSRDEELLANY